VKNKSNMNICYRLYEYCSRFIRTVVVTCVPLYRGGAATVIMCVFVCVFVCVSVCLGVCLSVDEVTHERVDGCRQNSDDPLKVIKFWC